MIMDNWAETLLPHSKQIKCHVCYSMYYYYMKCLSLCPDDHEYMRVIANTWYCSSCNSLIVPLNTIEEADISLCELNGINIDEHTIGSLAECLFNPFQLNYKDCYTPLSEIDPDVNFITLLIHTWVSVVNIIWETLFMIWWKLKQIAFQQIMYFPHVTYYIRNLRANLSTLEITLDNLRIHFTAIGVSENSLNDHICDQYTIDTQIIVMGQKCQYFDIW